jgi:flagellar hook-basal body complex protein FliE
MSDMHIQGVLAQIRAMSAQAAGGIAGPRVGSEVQRGEFSALLKQAVQHVNGQQQQAAQMADAFERGAPGVDLAQTMLSMQNASLSFQGVVQVRNHLLAAYREIMSMQV